MKYLLSILTLALVFAPVVAAQEMEVPKPAPEMAKFDKTVGTWTGKGTVTMMPGTEPMPWSATQTSSMILDGHFVQVDMLLDVGMGVPMGFRTLHGFDATKGVYTDFSVGSGGGKSGTMFWADANTVVSSSTQVEQGMVVTDRSVVKYDGDQYTIVIERGIGGDEFFPHVEGTFKRGGEAINAVQAASEGAMMPPAAELKPFGKMAGAWRLKGKMTPAPGAPAMEVGGHQEVKVVFGGHAVFAKMVGDEMPGMPGRYHAHHYLQWDPGSKRVVGFYASNMGEGMFGESYAVEDGSFVDIGAMVYQGVPTVHRGITKPNGKGGFTMTGWTMSNMDDPAINFEGTLTRVQAE